MKYEIVKLGNISGPRASVYSVIVGDEGPTLYEKFIDENIADFPSEVKEIVFRLGLIGSKFGAREDWFKLYEGKGDLVCALYDKPNKNLRLYCIKFGSGLLIVGGGGSKPKGMKALQESPKLEEENAMMRFISDEIYRLRKEGELDFSDDGMDLIGQLKINYDEDE